MESWTIQPCSAVRGTLTVPGDKSLSHRAAILAALAAGESTLTGFLESEDCLHTLRAMAALGARVEREADRVCIRGTGGTLRAPAGPLDLGNSGTGMRLLAGVLAGQAFASELTGDASLRSRPMRRIAEPLERMGARVVLAGANGRAPIRIAGAALRPVDYALPVASAQVKSCVLLAGLYAEGRTAVTEPAPTRDHTERMLAALGAPVRVAGPRIELDGGAACRAALRAHDWAIPGDISSAAYWLAAAAGMPGSEIRVEGVGLNPRRTALLDVLRRMGAVLRVEADEAGAGWEPRGTVTVRAGALRGTEIGGAEIPNLIDELPMLAALGARAEGETRIRDARELRVKESDRIASMAAGLAALGVAHTVFEDGIAVRGPAVLRGGATVDSRGDHRIAMALAVLALGAPTPVTVRDVACAATSYPGFLHDLETVRAA
jgi:3-phosphoshikimate 1-carboxyvinyltransferase